MDTDFRLFYPSSIPPVPSKAQIPTEPKKLLLPEKNENNARVVAYPTGRGIHRDIIDYCIQTKRLYESHEYHNVVFVGFDRHGTPKYAMFRGTSTMRYMGEANGSDKHYSFSIPASNQCRKIHLFESAIDLLSYCTLELISDRNWRQENHLSLAGIYKPKQNVGESTLPSALLQFLKDYTYIDCIDLHLDNDTAGRLAAKTIQTILPPNCTVFNDPPKRGKDYNDYLRIVLRTRQSRERGL